MKGASYRSKHIVSLVSKRGHDLSVVNDNGVNVLHFIVSKNDELSLELLNSLEVTQLSSEVINRQDNRLKHTPLHIAAMHNNHKAIVWLLQHGADTSIKDYQGICPAEQHGCDEHTKTRIQSFRK